MCDLKEVLKIFKVFYKFSEPLQAVNTPTKTVQHSIPQVSTTNRHDNVFAASINGTNRSVIESTSGDTTTSEETILSSNDCWFSLQRTFKDSLKRRATSTEC